MIERIRDMRKIKNEKLGCYSQMVDVSLTFIVIRFYSQLRKMIMFFIK